MTTPPDAGWIADAVEAYEHRLVAYVTRILRDAERARDVVQDAFLKLCKQDRTAVDGHLAEWLYTVCRNGAVDVLRKEKRMSPSPDAGATLTAGRDSDPRRRLETTDAHGRILRLMETLPESQREVLRLKFQHELSYREIAEIVGKTVNHVGVLIHNGLKALRAKAALGHPAQPAGGRTP